jgi:hypothetical protein
MLKHHVLQQTMETLLLGKVPNSLYQGNKTVLELEQHLLLPNVVDVGCECLILDL